MLSPSIRPIVLVIAATLVASAAPGPSAQEAAQSTTVDLTGLSLEELMNIEVTVASRRSEKLRDVPAAVYVLTGDEIRRAGMTSIQEAMRMVPGFHVTQWKTAGWDVTARGFTGSLSALNESFANQLLLLVDGVSLYSPAMAGIWWPLVDIPMSDIDRIEIVRGPGGILWGANAMNGVINVITKHSRDTLGQRVNTTVGVNENSGDYSYGGPLGDKGTFRSWVSYSDYRALRTADGDRLPEDWWIGSVGVRGDWELAPDRHARVYSTLHTSSFGEEPSDTAILGLPPFDDTPKNGGFVLGSLDFGTDGDTQRLQAWYSFDHQKQVRFTHDLQTLDLEYSRQQPLDDHQALTWGVGYRIVQSDLGSPNGFVDFSPEFLRQYATRAFIHDQIEIPSLHSHAIVGVQAENSTLGDFQVQPNVRWLWNATPETAIWAGVSRAVRTPSVEEVDIVQYDPPTDPPFFQGFHDFQSESVVVTEIGVRTNVTDKVMLDVTAFYNDFDNLQSFEDPGNTGFATTFDNKASAVARGAELAIDYDVRDDWRVRMAYTYFEMNFEADADSFESTSGYIDVKDGLIPENHVNLRSYYDLNEHWELDSAVYWTDRLPAFGQPAYWRVDARLGYHPNANVHFALGVQNLTERYHSEAGEGITSYGADIPQNIYLSLSVSF